MYLFIISSADDMISYFNKVHVATLSYETKISIQDIAGGLQKQFVCLHVKIFMIQDL